MTEPHFLHDDPPRPGAAGPSTLLLLRRGWSPSGGAERYLTRFTEALIQRDIRPILVTDGAWPEDQWPGKAIEILDGNDPVAALERVRARYPDTLIFSMDRIPGVDLFRAGDGSHASWLHRQQEAEGKLRGTLRMVRPFHRNLLHLEQQLYSDPKLRIIANSRMVARDLQHFHAVPPERITIIPNGYDAPELSVDQRRVLRDQTRAELGIPAHARVFLFVGSGWKRKGAATLVRAFRILSQPDAHLILVGKGSVSGTGHARIHVTGPVREPLRYFCAADVFTLPTLYDPFSNACLEAAALGLPVLTTNANGFAEVIETHPPAGEVLPLPRDPYSWAQALSRWMEPARWQQAAPSLDEIRRHFTVARNVGQTWQLIQTTSFLP